MTAVAGDRPVVLVTGAARGIGAAVVRRLVARGCDVHALDACFGEDGGTPYAQATTADLERVAAESPEHVVAVVADARDGAQVQTAVQALVDRHGRIDGVVAAAAVVEGGQALWETDPELPTRLWQSDVMTVWHTARAAVPHLLAQPEGRPTGFVAVSSAAGERGLWHLAAYCTVKHAVNGLVRGLAADLRGTAVTVCAVAPGSTGTPMLQATADLYGLESTKELESAQALGRALDPDEVARVAEFGVFAGPAVHGSVLNADGGFGL